MKESTTKLPYSYVLSLPDRGSMRCMSSVISPMYVHLNSDGPRLRIFDEDAGYLKPGGQYRITLEEIER